MQFRQTDKTYQIWPIVSFAAMGLFVGAYCAPVLHLQSGMLGPLMLFLIGFAMWFYAEWRNARDRIRYNDLILASGIGLAFAGLGSSVATVKNHAPSSAQIQHIERSELAILVVSSDTLTRPYGMIARAKLLAHKTRQGWHQVNGPHPAVRITLYDGQGPNQFQSGDTIFTTAKLRPVAEGIQPIGFDFGAYLRRQGIYLKTSLARDNYIVHRHQQSLIRDLKFNLRNILERNIRASTSNHDALGLLLGFALGQRQGLDQDTNTEFGITGTAHVLSVSGMHTLVLISTLMAIPILFKMNGRKKLIWAISSLLILWLYTAISGFSMPAVRSSIMSTFMLLGQLTNRQSRMLHSLSLAVCLIILFEPMAVHDISFHLSIAGCLGISLLAPRWYEQLAMRVHARFAKSLLHASLTTLGAAIATMPISAAQFGYIPTYFMLGNAIVGPLSSVLTIISLLLGLVGQVPFIGWSVSVLAEVIAGLTRTVVSLLSTLPSATVSVGTWPIVSFVLAGCSIFILAQLFWYRQRWASWALYSIPLLLAAHFVRAKVRGSAPETYAFYRKGAIAAVSSTTDTLYHLGYSPTNAEIDLWHKKYPFKYQKTVVAMPTVWQQGYELRMFSQQTQLVHELPGATYFLRYPLNTFTSKQVVLFNGKGIRNPNIHSLTTDGYWHSKSD